MYQVHLLSLLLIAWGSVPGDAGPIVSTPLGRVRGYTGISRSGRHYFAFSGIPYAKPPVGRLRFQPPEDVPPWEGVKDAVAEGPMCMQPDPVTHAPLGSEDCLHLSVFTHNVSGNSPVLVHIHGGAFMSGSGGYYGPEYMMDEDIVVVNINYRLGIFGFFSLETPEMPGNQGMKDQVLALKWVQQNIASFGGNPNLVTIDGESAGGASVYHHLLSPLSRGLFHRAIAESGTSYVPWAVPPPGVRRSKAIELMPLMNCPINPADAIPCMMGKKANDLLVISGNLTAISSLSTLSFGPVIEEPSPTSFLVGLPNEWTTSPVPLLLGTTSAEGFIETTVYLSKNFNFKWFSGIYNRMAPMFLLYFNTASYPDEITKEIRNNYLPNKEITLNDFLNLTMVVSDAAFTVGIMDGANEHKGDAYFYYFDYRLPLAGVDDKYVIGATHCAESAFIWNISYSPLPSKPNVLETSKNLVKAIGNFMREGVPSIEGIVPKWETWTAENHNYVQIDSEGFHLKKGLAEERYAFWKSINYNDLWRKIN